MAKKEIDVSIGIDALIEKGFFYLEEHQWKRAKECFEKAMEISPRNPYPYIGKLLVTHKLSTMDSLPECPIDFRNTNNYKTALRYADKNLKIKFESYVAQYEEKFDKKYQAMCSEFSAANSLEDYIKCYEGFVSFGKYKDSQEFAQKAKEFITQYNYEAYVKKVDDNMSEDECLKIYNDLLSMDYKESKKYATLYKEKYDKVKCENEKESIYRSAISRMSYAMSCDDYMEIKTIFESIAGYKDSAEYINQCEERIKGKPFELLIYKFWNNTIALRVATVLAFILPFVFLDSAMAWATIIIEAIGLFIGYNVTKDSSKDNKTAAAKGMFVGAASVCVFCIAIFALIGGLDGLFDSGSSSSDYCGICGGDGIFFDEICDYCGGWGSR